MHYVHWAWHYIFSFWKQIFFDFQAKRTKILKFIVCKNVFVCSLSHSIQVNTQENVHYIVSALQNLLFDANEIEVRTEQKKRSEDERTQNSKINRRYVHWAEQNEKLFRDRCCVIKTFLFPSLSPAHFRLF